MKKPKPSLERTPEEEAAHAALVISLMPKVSGYRFFGFGHYSSEIEQLVFYPAHIVHVKSLQESLKGLTPYFHHLPEYGVYLLRDSSYNWSGLGLDTIHRGVVYAYYKLVTPTELLTDSLLGDEE